MKVINFIKNGKVDWYGYNAVHFSLKKEEEKNTKYMMYNQNGEVHIKIKGALEPFAALVNGKQPSTVYKNREGSENYDDMAYKWLFWDVNEKQTIIDLFENTYKWKKGDV